MRRSSSSPPIISPSNNDLPEYKVDRLRRGVIERDRPLQERPLHARDPAKRDPLAFLAVKSMLLTGFDAPLEGVMYLDRSLREADLLQALARVNPRVQGQEAGPGRRLLRGRPPPQGGAQRLLTPPTSTARLQSVADEVKLATSTPG